MTISPSPSPRNGSLTLQFSDVRDYKLYPWFDEAFNAHAKLSYPLFGINPQMKKLFPGYSSEDERGNSSKVFAVTLEFSGPNDGVPKDMCLKLARGIDGVVHLSHEASVYRKELAKLWGIAVPRMHGFFVGHHDNAPVAALLLELCIGPEDLRYDAEEFMYVPFDYIVAFFFTLMLLIVGLNMDSRLAMQTVRKVHDIGITQNLPLELHHFVMKDHNVLLVNFSHAVTHQCKAASACTDQRICHDEEDELEEDEFECDELMTIAKEDMRAVSVSLPIEDGTTSTP